MKTMKLAVSRTSLATRIAALRKDSRARLKKFCIDTVVSKKLAARTFSFEFDFSGERDGTMKKSIQRMRELILKSVEKQIPYVSYASGGLILRNRSSQGVLIEVKLFPKTIKIKRGQHVEDILEDVKDIKSIRRYCRRLNREAIKAGQTLSINLVPSWQFPNNEESVKFNDLQNKSRDFEMDLSIVPVIKVNVNVGVWVLTTYNDLMLRAPTLRSRYPEVDDFIAAIQRKDRDLVDFGVNVEDVYSRDLWFFHNPPDSQRNGRTEGHSRYRVPEKMFLIINQMQRILKTFARISSYDSSAFNIGTPED